MIAPVLATIDAVAATTPPAWAAAASVAAGGFVGLSLGLTGGGGAIFAVAGMLTTPVGSRLGGKVSPQTLMASCG